MMDDFRYYFSVCRTPVRFFISYPDIQKKNFKSFQGLKSPEGFGQNISGCMFTGLLCCPQERQVFLVSVPSHESLLLR